MGFRWQLHRNSGALVEDGLLFETIAAQEEG